MAPLPDHSCLTPSSYFFVAHPTPTQTNFSAVTKAGHANHHGTCPVVRCKRPLPKASLPRSTSASPTRFAGNSNLGTIPAKGLADILRRIHQPTNHHFLAKLRTSAKKGNSKGPCQRTTCTPHGS